MPDTTPNRTMELVQWAYAAAVAGVAVLLLASALIARDYSADVLPDWFGLLAAVIAAIPGFFVVRYYLRRPLEEDEIRDYAVTVLFRLGVAVLPAVAGFVFFLLTDAWWVVLVGAILTVPGLAWSVPSHADYQRHRSLATDVAEHPPEDVWGSAPEDEPGPWEDEPGHGHRLFE